MARDDMHDPLAELAGHYAAMIVCQTGKVSHPTMAEAWREARRMSQTPPKYGPLRPSEPYRCPFCGQIHIGRRSR